MSCTPQEFIQRAMEQLHAHSPSPRVDAEALAMHVCGYNRTQLVTRADTPLTPPQEQELNRLLAQRRAGRPVAYLTGTREFWSLELNVTPATLIPRADTETLVEQALALIPQNASWRIADLGTGSGAIALALAHERPRCHIVATDISAPALAVAQENALRHRLRNIEFRAGSWEAPLVNETFEVIVSNPPYIRDNDPHLSAGDVRFEPRTALVAGSDGLDAIRYITEKMKTRIRPGGWLLLEHGYDQAAQVSAILHAHGYGNITCGQDLAGHARVSLGQLPGEC